MARKRKRGTKSPPGPLMIHPDAAGIDIGATEIFVAVPPARDANQVRSFPTFTQDLNALADWLHGCGIETGAMESTGVYLDSAVSDPGDSRLRGLPGECTSSKTVPGRKTDVSDCQSSPAPKQLYGCDANLLVAG